MHVELIRFALLNEITAAPAEFEGWKQQEFEMCVFKSHFLQQRSDDGVHKDL